MFVCRVTNDTSHRIVSILSSSGGTPFYALRKAVEWHQLTFPDVTLTYAAS